MLANITTEEESDIVQRLIEKNHLKAKPFVKWVGGKTQLLPELTKRIPKIKGRYYEPFLGGGALFFHIQSELDPSQGCISDINSDLISAYRAVKHSPQELIDSLQKHRYEKEYFNRVRELDRKTGYSTLSEVEKASRLIFLNKTCYNGIYRVNKKGQFNVPFGQYKNPSIFNKENLLACSQALQKAEIHHVSFETIASTAQPGDFVYFDPPYIPLSASSNFTEYNSNGFDLTSQQMLRDVCLALDERGVSFLLSNSSSPLVYELYENHFEIEVVDASRAINSRGNKRGKVKEVLIGNYL